MSNQAETEMERVARQMLAGDLELVEGCRKLVQIHRGSGAPDFDAIITIITIIGIESETDDLPVGVERERWAPDALKHKDRQRDEYLAQVRAPLMDALQLLAERWPNEG